MRAGIPLLIGAALAACDVVGIGDSKDTYNGDVAGSFAWFTKANVTCTTPYAVTGKLKIELTERDGKVSGRGDYELVETPGVPAEQGCGPAPGRSFGGHGAISGMISDFTFTHSYTAQGVITERTTATFVGSLSSGIISGMLTIEHSGSGFVPENQGVQTTTGGTGVFSVTLKK